MAPPYMNPYPTGAGRLAFWHHADSGMEWREMPFLPVPGNVWSQLTLLLWVAPLMVWGLIYGVIWVALASHTLFPVDLRRGGLSVQASKVCAFVRSSHTLALCHLATGVNADCSACVPRRCFRYQPTRRRQP
jgi:hypothetical protein